jgi:hypothetical protein
LPVKSSGPQSALLVKRKSYIPAHRNRALTHTVIPVTLNMWCLVFCRLRSCEVLQVLRLTNHVVVKTTFTAYVTLINFSSCAKRFVHLVWKSSGFDLQAF